MQHGSALDELAWFYVGRLGMTNSNLAPRRLFCYPNLRVRAKASPERWLSSIATAAPPSTAPRNPRRRAAPASRSRAVRGHRDPRATSASSPSRPCRRVSYQFSDAGNPARSRRRILLTPSVCGRMPRRVPFRPAAAGGAEVEQPVHPVNQITYTVHPRIKWFHPRRAAPPIGVTRAVARALVRSTSVIIAERRRRPRRRTMNLPRRSRATCSVGRLNASRPSRSCTSFTSRA